MLRGLPALQVRQAVWRLLQEWEVVGRRGDCSAAEDYLRADAKVAPRTAHREDGRETGGQIPQGGRRRRFGEGAEVCAPGAGFGPGMLQCDGDADEQSDRSYWRCELARIPHARSGYSNPGFLFRDA